MLLPILVAASVQPSHCFHQYMLHNKHRSSSIVPFYFNLLQFRLYNSRRPAIVFRFKTNLSTTIRRLATVNDNSISSSNKVTETRRYTSLTFFKFIEISEVVLDDLVNEFKSQLNNSISRGSLIIASEGLNGQFCVPSDQLDSFMKSIRVVLRRKYLSDDVDFNVGDTLHYPIAVSDDNDGENYEPLLSVPEGLPFPFRKLIIRRKRAILSDGMLREKGLTLNWQDAGPELSPSQWHNSLTNLNKTTDAQNQPLLLGDNYLRLAMLYLSIVIYLHHLCGIISDCRNTYESEMGTFQGAVPLNTSSFGESWQNLEQLLADQPRDRPLLTFCTGGIRCVKVAVV